MSGDTTQEIERTEGESEAVVEYNPSKLLALAVQQDLDVDKLERLMAMQERWDAQRAKEAFFNALSRFQQAVPVLEKRQVVDFTPKAGGKVRYTYAALSDIAEQIRACLSECGLSYRWEFADIESLLEVTCILTHLSGHSEKTAMTAPADTSGSKNPVQERASTITYLQRYTLIGALGLATANLDDDGRQGTTGEPLPEGTDTKAPRPETKGDHEKQAQLLGLLETITESKDAKKLSAELEKLTTFKTKEGETKQEGSLKNLTGKWLNTALGKAREKIKAQLIKLLECPGLLQEIVDEMTAMIGQGQDGDWYRKQIEIVKGFIADAEKP